MTIRLGLIGYGAWGKKIAAEIQRTSGFELRAVACRSSSAPGGHFVDWRQLLDSNWPGLHGIIAACPPYLNVQIAEACADAHMPLWLEKPMTLSVTDAEHIRAVCLAAQIPVLVDHTYLFHPLWPQVRALVRDWGAESYAYCNVPVEPRHDFSPLWDWCAHDLAALIDAFGTPTDADPVSSAWAVLNFANNCSARLSTSPTRPGRFIQFSAGDHKLVFTPDSTGIEAHGTHHDHWLFDHLPFSPLQHALIEFGAMIEAKQYVDDYLSIGVNVVRTLEKLWPISGSTR